MADIMSSAVSAHRTTIPEAREIMKEVCAFELHGCYYNH
jgi:hypothetical protein